MNSINNTIKVIGFDADDTLWDNEPFYRETEAEFCNLLKNYMPSEKLNEELFKTEINNLGTYGYGIKAFTLSLIETAIRISDGKVNAKTINGIIELGKKQLQQPVKLLSNVKNVLEELKSNFTLIVATKGDLLDQEKKLQKSNLTGYFRKVEIMSEKKENNYLNIIHRLDIAPNEFMMVGNSLKSDVIPVLNIGGYGVFVPYHTTWLHEHADENEIQNENFIKILSIAELPTLLKKK